MDYKAARDLLEAGDVFFDEEEPIVNLNDVWDYATADGEPVPASEMPELARLFREYGWCGVLYWVSERRHGTRSKLDYINRKIDFVAYEEW